MLPPVPWPGIVEATVGVIWDMGGHQAPSSVPTMVAEPLVIEFQEGSRDAVVDRMATLAGSRTGWVNLTPGLDVDEPPPTRSLLSQIFGAKGPDVPLATWNPQGRPERDPFTVGIHHAQGPKVLNLLRDNGIGPPETWRRLQDHPKRGLVLAVPASTDRKDLDATVDWLLIATGFLCPVRRTGEWRALVYGV